MQLRLYLLWKGLLFRVVNSDKINNVEHDPRDDDQKITDLQH